MKALVATILVFAAPLIAGCDEPGSPQAQALFERLEAAPDLTPARAALAMPDARFICTLDYGDGRQAVKSIRETFGEPVPDARAEGEADADSSREGLYVVTSTSDHFIIVRSKGRMISATEHAGCVRGETAMFKRRTSGNWELRGDNGKPDDWMRAVVKKKVEQIERRNAKYPTF